MYRLATLNNPKVRDLANSCFSANLIEDYQALPGAPSQLQPCPITLTESRLHWLHELDRQPQVLYDCLNELSSTRLGLYFEKLWQFFIDQDPELSLISHNLAIYNNKQTLGEFDLIYFCHQRQCYIHLELALKFYLWHPTAALAADPFSHWLGPNAVDRFDLKLNRLLSHQTRLSETEAGQTALQQLNIERIQRELALKGRLFYSGSDKIQQPQLHPSHPQGYWLHLEEFIKPQNAVYDWQLLTRDHWISPPNTITTPIHHQSVSKQLMVHFETYRQSVMLLRHCRHSQQTHCVFVTHNQWPLTKEQQQHLKVNSNPAVAPADNRPLNC